MPSPAFRATLTVVPAGPTINRKLLEELRAAGAVDVDPVRGLRESGAMMISLKADRNQILDRLGDPDDPVYKPALESDLAQNAMDMDRHRTLLLHYQMELDARN